MKQLARLVYLQRVLSSNSNELLMNIIHTYLFFWVLQANKGEFVVKKVLIALAIASISAPVLAAKGDSGFGVEGGLAIVDLDDAATALGQSLANATGRTVTYTYEESSIAFRM